MKYEASDRLRGMVRQSEIDKWMIAKGAERKEGTATETASRLNSIQMNWSLWHQNSVRKQSMLTVKKQDFNGGTCQGCLHLLELQRISRWRKIAFADTNKHFSEDKLNLLIDGRGVQAFRAHLALSNIMEIPLLTCSLTSIFHILNAELMEGKRRNA